MLKQTRKNDNAFPLYLETDYEDIMEDGLTKREYFAIKIMAALIVDDTYLLHSIPTKAVILADELIKVLNEQE